jgi:hypothetical protein
MYQLPSEYFNTTNLKGPMLQKEARNARRQESLILDYFKRKRTLTPSQIYRYRVAVGLNNNVPITSIRRSITVLTNEGLLIKTNQQKIGIYGKPEYVWQINTFQEYLSFDSLL